MIVITRFSRAQDAPEMWRRQYFNSQNEWHKSKTEKLMALKEPINADEVDSIIGNKSWTRVDDCGECNKSGLDKVIEIGQEPEYESYTAYLCIDCLRKGIEELEK